MKNLFCIIIVSLLSSTSLLATECPELFKWVVLSERISYGEKIPGLRPIIQYGMKLDATGGMITVYLPNAKRVEVMSEANGWGMPIALIKDNKGVWSGHIDNITSGMEYNLKILDAKDNVQYRMDPHANFVTRELKTMHWHSVAWDQTKYKWHDQNFVPSQKMTIVEVHPATIIPGKPKANFREIADFLLKTYDEDVTHFSFMPVTHYNVRESWGYQPGGLFSVDENHGTPDDFKYMIDKLHQNNRAIILDLVYGHSSMDWDTGLANIDGTELYFKKVGRELHSKASEDLMIDKSLIVTPTENQMDIDMGSHPEWGTKIYEFNSQATRNYLLSNAYHWMKEYHIDGARVDGVSSMIHLDYGRGNNWIPSIYGNNVDVAALDFMRELNTLVHTVNPNFVSIAEDSSAVQMTTQAITEGGLGFDYIWGIGGMHHSRDFLKAPYNERNLFALYQPVINEDWGKSHRYINYLNSHDETSQGDRRFFELINADSLLEKHDIARMMMAHIYMDIPGHPMILQADELAPRTITVRDTIKRTNQFGEIEYVEIDVPVQKGWWDEKTPADIDFFTGHPAHQQFKTYFEALNHFFQQEHAFNKVQLNYAENLLVDNNAKVGVMARYGEYESDSLVVIHNFSKYEHQNYRIPVPGDGKWSVVFDSDRAEFGGNNLYVGVSQTEQVPVYGKEFSVVLNLPSMSTVVLKRVD